jgi:hypothetical protein
LRNRLWAQTHSTAGSFSGRTELVLEVPCTYDLNVAATKYFHALADGEVSLLFLFGGTVFYLADAGRLQVQPISWNAECEYQMPVRVWQDLMEIHYPNSAWVCLHKEVFDRLCSYKRQYGMISWEQTFERLLANETSALEEEAARV